MVQTILVFRNGVIALDISGLHCCNHRVHSVPLLLYWVGVNSHTWTLPETAFAGQKSPRNVITLTSQQMSALVACSQDLC